MPVKTYALFVKERIGWLSVLFGQLIQIMILKYWMFGLEEQSFGLVIRFEFHFFLPGLCFLYSLEFN
jgi:hypothetical protein